MGRGGYRDASSLARHSLGVFVAGNTLRIRVRAGSVGHRHGRRRHQVGAAGRDGDRDRSRKRRPDRRRHRRARRVPPAAPAGDVQDSSGADRLRSVIVPKVELLVGQNANVTISLKVATVSEAITVSAESPLIDTSSSQVAGNVDRRQMEDLPLQGRNWMELSKMVKGITANDVNNNRPGVDTDDMFQLNLDGQQVTQKTAGSGFGQPKFSRESIAEFQIVTTMFDITQGRSAGIEIQAISKSGTNTNSGSFYGYFRSDQFNAEDPVAHVVLPYSNQQVGGSFGGPIVKDRLHYFASYEYEREPNTIVTSPTQLPGQSFTNSSKTTQKSVMGRLDDQISANHRVSARVSKWDWDN